MLLPSVSNRHIGRNETVGEVTSDTKTDLLPDPRIRRAEQDLRAARIRSNNARSAISSQSDIQVSGADWTSDRQSGSSMIAFTAV